MKFSSVEQIDCVLWSGKQTSSVSSFRSVQLPAWLNAIASAVVERFIRPRQPVIYYGQNGNGEIWRVYDPQTQQEAMFSNENEVRVWLEHRYYQ